MAPPVVNPLDMPCIIEKVLDYVEPVLLQPCRLVNHTWNQLTSSRMKKAGWVLNLTSERLEEYLRILEATEKNRGTATEEPKFSEQSRMELRLHLQISPESRGMKELLATALRRVRHPEGPNRKVPNVVSLWLEYVKTHSASEPTELEERHAGVPRPQLITKILYSVRELIIRLNDGPHNVDWILPYLPRQPNVVCPNLEAISVEYNNSTTALLVPKVIDQVVRHANEENLRRLNLFPNGNIASLVSTLEGPYDSPDVGQNRATAILLSLTACHNLCSSLLELNLHLEYIRMLQFVDTLHFDQLRILRVSSAISDDIFAFVHTNCPMLNTLEFIDCTVPHQGGQDVLPNLTQLGFYRRYDSRAGALGMWILAYISFLNTLEKCPNVTTVNTNFITWLELTTWFTHKFGNVNLEGEGQDFVLSPAILNRVFPTVSTLRIDTPKSSVLPDPDERRMRIICWFIHRMFPNLTKLVIDLNPAMETPLLYRGVGGRLRYILGLIFGIPSLRHVEMKNVDNQWHLLWPMTFQLGDPVVSPAPPSALESVTIQAAQKCYDRSILTSNHPTSRRDARAPPELDLDALLSALPAQCPDLVLRIDARLLLNFRKYDDTDYEHQRPIYPHKPYERLVEDLKTRTNPRIQLI